MFEPEECECDICTCADSFARAIYSAYRDFHLDAPRWNVLTEQERSVWRKIAERVEVEG